MNHTLTIPYFEREVEWESKDKTFIIGENGTGKTLLLNEMMNYCDEKGYEYVHYDAIYDLSEFDSYITSDSDDIALACKMMDKIFQDFSDDMNMWAIAELSRPLVTHEDYVENIDLVKKVLSLAGNGYKRMFVMLMKAIDKPHANYYFMDLPETSLHIMVARIIVDFLMSNFEYMQFVIASQSPEVVEFMKHESVQLVDLSMVEECAE